jgi:hypothetical protein
MNRVAAMPSQWTKNSEPTKNDKLYHSKNATTEKTAATARRISDAHNCVFVLCFNQLFPQEYKAKV